MTPTIALATLVLTAHLSGQVGAQSRAEVGGAYRQSATLEFRNSPFRATSPIIVYPGANLTIEQGVEIYFSAGVGIHIQGGILHAVGAPMVRIRLLPEEKTQSEPDNSFRTLRLVDGPSSTRHGRLETYFQGRWRAVCTQLTNWTDTDFHASCRSLGYSGGGFYRWYRRNNDTRPFVMPRPGCQSGDQLIEECMGWSDVNRIPLSENLCQGEDDIGISCWGEPTFSGWDTHWRGIQFVDSPWGMYPDDDPNGIAVKKRSKSRLEWIDIYYAGFDRETGNTTAAVDVRGVPPVLNFVEVVRSAGDGINVLDASGPVEITNSTISYNRGHGVAVYNTSDGRVFINQTRIQFNHGDGVHYTARLGLGYSNPFDTSLPQTDQFYHPDRVDYDLCLQSEPPQDQHFYPRLVQLTLRNGTYIGDRKPVICAGHLDIPNNLPYTYSVQFLSVENLNPNSVETRLRFCESGPECSSLDAAHEIPIRNNLLPSTVVTQNKKSGLWLSLLHENSPNDVVLGDVRVLLRVHALVTERKLQTDAALNILYGLNVSNSLVADNLGRGLYLEGVRDRTVVDNVTLSRNQHIAGFQIYGGAGDVWINNTIVNSNLGDGINITFAGGSVVINGTQLINNLMRGITLHQNETLENLRFMPLRQQVVILGRRANSDETPTVLDQNHWGGIIVGNFCSHAYVRIRDPVVLVTHVSFLRNHYHPAFEYHSCQRDDSEVTRVELVGSRCQQSESMCVRVQPAVNIRLSIRDNRFYANNRPALIIRNRDHPQLWRLPATVSLISNQFKRNSGQFIVSVGLNEDAPHQAMVIEGQNEIRDNRVINPYPHLNPRNRPFAALVISSSNVRLQRNCFDNPQAKYEIATDVSEHAKVIIATENSWGSSSPDEFMPRVFDNTKRYNLATFKLDPYAILCNSHNPQIQTFVHYIPPFRDDTNSNLLGGMIFESVDLRSGRYRVHDDLHVLPGARLNIEPGTVLQFEDSIGMLVQGQVLRGGVGGSGTEVITFTSSDFSIPPVQNVRLVDANGDLSSTQGRLEVLLDGEQEWGTVCNRSWTVTHAHMVCNQLGLISDPEFLENWWTWPLPGEQPIVLDNVRCEELETDLTKCRHDGPLERVNVTCPRDAVVGLRCVEPRWAGVRYTLLANPPSVTEQEHIHHLLIERAGLFDFSLPLFSPALQIDWNYHTFSNLIVRDNFWTGLDIVYNDLVKKPKLEKSSFIRNRRHGIRARSVGLTIENCNIDDNQNAGFRYNPILSPELQRDVVTWLQRDDIAKAQISFIPDKLVDTIELLPSVTGSRRFLVARDCANPPCAWTGMIRANNIQSANDARIGVHIINRPSNVSDESLVLIDESAGIRLDVRNDLIRFPFVTKFDSLRLEYKKTFGSAKLMIQLFYQNAYDFLDPFIHIAHSTFKSNQYAVSTLHYSNFTHEDGSIINRYTREQLWFQKCNFTNNKQAVIWVNGPLRDANTDSPIAVISYFLDNSSITENNGSVIETHRDLYRSANVFQWRVWRSNLIGNFRSGFDVSLPDTYDLFASDVHKFEFTENDMRYNSEFEFHISGFYTWCNISANNFTENTAAPQMGIARISGMEKSMIMERNRFHYNRGRYMVLYDTQSHAVRFANRVVPSRISNNYFTQNAFLSPGDNLVDNFPRSFALGVVGVQRVNVSYNNFRNDYMDFEALVGLKSAPIDELTNLSHNYWGKSSGSEISARIFDFDDWNTLSVAQFNPFIMSEEYVARWDWDISQAQLDSYQPTDPTMYDLKGRLFTSLTLSRQRSQWPSFPFDWKPDRPYRISKDLTVMPGATLTIEKGVELHMHPGVRILVLGNLIAEGTHLEPIRFRPINVTEMEELQQTRQYRIQRHLKDEVQKRQVDSVYRKFPLLHRQDTFFQKFNVFLIKQHLTSSLDDRSGFLEIYNSTTGEMVPICDRQFTNRNAQVVCRELGFETRGNAYSFVTARFDYNPRLRIIRAYSEPRQCVGTEPRLSDCDLRLHGDRDLWYCSDTLHFVYVHCGRPVALYTPVYPEAWGGITFARTSFEVDTVETTETNIMRYAEVVGAGRSHNLTEGAALEYIFRPPILDNVNITNSSMHGITVIGAGGPVELHRVNITENLGRGLNVLNLNLLGPTSSSAPLDNVTIPYHMLGMVDMCSVRKSFVVHRRVLVYYKYDSYPVDCVKILRSQGGRHDLSFRFLQVNMYNSHDAVGRPDELSLFKGPSFSAANRIASIRHGTPGVDRVFTASSSDLGLFLRANAADGIYGFVAEVFKIPATPQGGVPETFVLQASRIEHNDRGGLQYKCMGEKTPDLRIENCYFGRNGYHIWGNLTTSRYAAELDLQNTLSMKLSDSMFNRNIGGLYLRAGSSTSIARMEGLVRSCSFSHNNYFETMRLEGKDYQKLTLVNNYLGKNWVPYRDIVSVDRMLTNFSHNIFYNNTGTHIADISGYSSVQTEFQVFQHNYLYDNVALGHGYQFNRSYGYFPPYKVIDQGPFPDSRKRRRRQTGQGRTTSFEWWAQVGSETERYRSTILAATAQQRFEYNFFNNEANDFELTTSNKSRDSAYNGPLEAPFNWWGYPGTSSVAAGRIRDFTDLPYLVRINYQPVLQTNSTLLEEDCPPGWFYAGQDQPVRTRSCFLFVGGGMPFSDASKFCLDNDGFMPYFQQADPRLSAIVDKLRSMIVNFHTPIERYFRNPYDEGPSEIIIWISGTTLPPQQCGYLSSASGQIGYYNCEGMLPFVCEKGPNQTQSWFWLSPAGITSALCLVILCLLVCIVLTFCLVKARRRQHEHFERKTSLRASLRSNASPKKQLDYPPPDLISSAHARLAMGASFDSLVSRFGSTSTDVIAEQSPHGVCPIGGSTISITQTSNGTVTHTHCSGETTTTGDSAYETPNSRIGHLQTFPKKVLGARYDPVALRQSQGIVYSEDARSSTMSYDCSGTVLSDCSCTVTEDCSDLSPAPSSRSSVMTLVEFSPKHPPAKPDSRSAGPRDWVPSSSFERRHYDPVTPSTFGYKNEAYSSASTKNPSAPGPQFKLSQYTPERPVKRPPAPPTTKPPPKPIPLETSM